MDCRRLFTSPARPLFVTSWREMVQVAGYLPRMHERKVPRGRKPTYLDFASPLERTIIKLQPRGHPRWKRQERIRRSFTGTRGRADLPWTLCLKGLQTRQRGDPSHTRSLTMACLTSWSPCFVPGRRAGPAVQSCPATRNSLSPSDTGAISGNQVHGDW